MPSIECRVQPNFALALTTELMDALIFESRNHYDYTCRSMTSPNGILTVWRNRVAVWQAEGLEDMTISVSWGDLDTLAKCCEMSRDKNAIAFYHAAMQAMKHYNDNHTAFPSKVLPIGN